MKKLLFIVVFILLFFESFMQPNLIMKAVSNGLSIWFQQILPSLLLFTICSYVFIKSNFLQSFHRCGNLIAVFIILICSFVFGFPIAAKLSGDFYGNQLISKKQAIILSICCNNFSPMYIMGFVLPYLFPQRDFIFQTFFTIYIIPVMIALLFLLCNREQKNFQKKSASRFQLDMQIIDAGIISGFETLIKICGYIVLFSVITTFLNQFTHGTNLWSVILFANLEITNGIQLLKTTMYSENMIYILTIQILSFGGICGYLQSASILSNHNLPLKLYFFAKLMLSIIETIAITLII